MLKGKSRLGQSSDLAYLSYVAYSDSGKEAYKLLGYTKYKAIAVNGAQCNVGSNTAEVVIAFRGTQITEVNDVFADLDVIKVAEDGGFVHQGFKNEAMKLWPEVKAWCNQNSGKDIYVTGHSLGAGMALYTAYLLKKEGLPVVQVITFGQPRLGDTKFLKNIPVPHLRYVDLDDIVPHVPPANWGYAHHGELCWIDSKGQISKMGAFDRWKEGLSVLIYSMFNKHPFKGIEDHDIHKYMTKITALLEKETK